MLAIVLLAALPCCDVLGSVHDVRGRPVAGAHIVLHGRVDAATNADTDGRFALRTAPRNNILSVTAPGFAATVFHADVHEGTTLDIVLAALDVDSPRRIGRVTIDGNLTLARGEVPTQNISRAELDNFGALRALDAISQVPSTTVARPLGGNATGTSVVALRGPDPSETLVALDGQLLNNANTGDFDLSQFPVAPLASIDISEGLGPEENHAANTIGGEVNLRTLQPTRDPHSSFTASYGSFDTSSFATQTTGERGRLGYAFAAQSLQSGGYVQRYPVTVGGVPTLLGSLLQGQSLLGSLAYDFSANASVRVRYFTLADQRDQSAAQDAPADLTQDVRGGNFAGPGPAFVTQGLRALLVSAKAPLGAGSVVASYATSGTTTTFNGGVSTSPYNLYNNDKLGTLSLGWERSTPSLEYAVGGYLRGESLDESAAFNFELQHERSEALTERVAFQASPRLRFALDAFETHYSTFGSSTDGRFGVTYDPDNRSVVRASVGTGFRAPLLAELYAVPYDVLKNGPFDSNCVAANGNPDEKPEHATAYEIGYGRRISERTTIDVSAYQTNLRDPIEIAYPLSARCPAAGPPTLEGQAIPVNVGGVIYRGGVLRVVHRAGFLALRAEYGLNAAYPTSLPAAVSNPTSGANLVVGEQFQGIPIATGTVGGRYERAGFHADLAMTYKGRNNELNDGAFALLGGALGQRIGLLDYTIAFRNITNAEAGRFTRIGLGLPYPSPLSPGGALLTDRLAIEPASVDLAVTLHL